MSEHTVVKFKTPDKGKKGKERIPCLVVVEGTAIGEIYKIEKKSVVIGRAETADITLSEEGISRQHARIDTHDDNAFTITDLGSTNGTVVNGTRAEQVALRDGDKIVMGDLMLSFSFQDVIDVNYQENLRNMAIRDGLTNIFNRRHFLETLNREVAYALRLRQPLSCAMFDIDHFKKVNDTYGHQAGDAVLKKLAQTLSEGLRTYDFFARYGGEEFVILLRGTALDNALIFAERIRKKAENMVVEYEGKKIPVTISIGVSAVDPDQSKEPDALVKEADRHLYDAKRGGRNCVRSVRNAT